MRLPRELFIELYRTGSLHGHAFDAEYWKPPGPRATDSWREACTDAIRDANQSLGVAALDLGLSLEVVRGYFADALRANHRFILGVTAGTAPARALAAFFALGIARDRAAARTYAKAYQRLGDDDYRWHRIRGGVVRVLIGHALGVPLAAAAKQLEAIPPNKEAGAKVRAIDAALRELTLHCATAKRPEPTALLGKLAEANAKLWRWEDGRLEAYLSQAGLAVACLARDRGWKLPDRDPHFSMPLALLRLKPLRIDLDDARFSPPSAQMKKLVRGLTKEALALLYPKAK